MDGLLKRLEESGILQRFIKKHGETWTARDFQKLLAEIERQGIKGLDIAAISRLLKKLKPTNAKKRRQIPDFTSSMELVKPDFTSAMEMMKPDFTSSMEMMKANTGEDSALVEMYEMDDIPASVEEDSARIGTEVLAKERQAHEEFARVTREMEVGELMPSSMTIEEAKNRPEIYDNAEYVGSFSGMDDEDPMSLMTDSVVITADTTTSEMGDLDLGDVDTYNRSVDADEESEIDDISDSEISASPWEQSELMDSSIMSSESGFQRSYSQDMGEESEIDPEDLMDEMMTAAQSMDSSEDSYVDTGDDSPSAKELDSMIMEAQGFAAEELEHVQKPSSASEKLKRSNKCVEEVGEESINSLDEEDLVGSGTVPFDKSSEAFSEDEADYEDLEEGSEILEAAFVKEESKDHIEGEILEADFVDEETPDDSQLDDEQSEIFEAAFADEEDESIKDDDPERKMCESTLGDLLDSQIISVADVASSGVFEADFSDEEAAKDDDLERKMYESTLDGDLLDSQIVPVANDVPSEILEANFDEENSGSDFGRAQTSYKPSFRGDFRDSQGVVEAVPSEVLNAAFVREDADEDYAVSMESDLLDSQLIPIETGPEEAIEALAAEDIPSDFPQTAEEDYVDPESIFAENAESGILDTSAQEESIIAALERVGSSSLQKKQEQQSKPEHQPRETSEKDLVDLNTVLSGIDSGMESSETRGASVVLGDLDLLDAKEPEHSEVSSISMEEIGLSGVQDAVITNDEIGWDAELESDDTIISSSESIGDMLPEITEESTFGISDEFENSEARDGFFDGLMEDEAASPKYRISIRAARSLYIEGKFSEALEQAYKALTLFPNEQLHRYIASLKKTVSTARSILEEAENLEHNENSEEALRKLAEIEEFYPHYAPAQKMQKRLLETGEKTTILSQKAEEFQKQQKFPEAISCWREIRELNPRFPEISRKIKSATEQLEEAEEIFINAFFLYECEQYEDAMTLAQECLKVYRHHESATLLVDRLNNREEYEGIAKDALEKGNRAFDNGDLKMALQIWEEALQIMGESFVLQKRITETKNILKKVEKLCKEARDCAERGLYEEAQKSLDECLQMFSYGEARTLKEQIRQQQYTSLVAEGDRLLAREKLAEALEIWNIARGLTGGTAELERKIEKIENVLNKPVEDKAKLARLLLEVENFEGTRRYQQALDTLYVIQNSEWTCEIPDFTRRIERIRAIILKQNAQRAQRQLQKIEELIFSNDWARVRHLLDDKIFATELPKKIIKRFQEFQEQSNQWEKLEVMRDDHMRKVAAIAVILILGAWQLGAWGVRFLTTSTIVEENSVQSQDDRYQELLDKANELAEGENWQQLREIVTRMQQLKPQEQSWRKFEEQLAGLEKQDPELIEPLTTTPRVSIQVLQQATSYKKELQNVLQTLENVLQQCKDSSIPSPPAISHSQGLVEQGKQVLSLFADINASASQDLVASWQKSQESDLIAEIQKDAQSTASYITKYQQLQEKQKTIRQTKADLQSMVRKIATLMEQLRNDLQTFRERDLNIPVDLKKMFKKGKNTYTAMNYTMTLLSTALEDGKYEVALEKAKRWQQSSIVEDLEGALFRSQNLLRQYQNAFDSETEQRRKREQKIRQKYMARWTIAPGSWYKRVERQLEIYEKVSHKHVRYIKDRGARYAFRSLENSQIPKTKKFPEQMAELELQIYLLQDRGIDIQASIGKRMSQPLLTLSQINQIKSLQGYLKTRKIDIESDELQKLEVSISDLRREMAISKQPSEKTLVQIRRSLQDIIRKFDEKYRGVYSEITNIANQK